MSVVHEILINFQINSLVTVSGVLYAPLILS